MRFSDPPPESMAAIHDTLATLAQGNRFSSEALRNVDPEQIKLTRPHRVYTLGLDDLRAGRSLSAAYPTSWRYLVERDGQPVALGETRLTGSGEHAFAQLNYGPFVSGTSEALGTAEQLLAEGDAEVRLLHVPALYLQAVWLHPPEDDDLLIPVAPTPSGIEAGQIRPASELLGLLRDRAHAIPVMAEGDERGG